ncbi:hypothetical protein [Paracidovorax valerianellae]|uniref:hypothetical protein n=1 Tax=Paracidovorax valerianellae TaxID=187868 RepID=UPI001587E3F1|nr:hypothetical protein [Paracidovorax valerianellae]MDA8445195.1 hypothetical protein [Paracidovorax valerianellae]
MDKNFGGAYFNGRGVIRQLYLERTIFGNFIGYIDQCTSLVGWAFSPTGIGIRGPTGLEHRLVNCWLNVKPRFAQTTAAPEVQHHDGDLQVEPVAELERGDGRQRPETDTGFAVGQGFRRA